MYQRNIHIKYSYNRTIEIKYEYIMKKLTLADLENVNQVQTCLVLDIRSARNPRTVNLTGKLKN